MSTIYCRGAAQSLLVIRPATALDADALLARGVRAADEAECRKMTGAGVPELLHESVAQSDCAAAVEYEGRIMALFGVASLPLCPLLAGRRMGLVWLVGHDDFERPELAVALARASRRFMACWLREYALLGNFVDPDNKTSLRWLAWLGFVIDRETPVYGPHGHVLYRFWREQGKAKGRGAT